HANLRIPLHEVPQALQPARGDRGARPQAARLPQVQVARGGAGVHGVLREDGSEKLARPVFERLRDALRAALDAATPPGNLRDLARQMREAVVEAKVSVQETREAVSRAGRQWQLARVERDRPLTEAERSAERAWRDLQEAGGVRPGGGTDLQDELLKSDLDRTAREAAADQQLRELKKKMKKD